MMNVEFYGPNGTLEHNATVASLQELDEMAEGRLVKIMGAGIIEHDDAMMVIEDYRVDNKLPGLLETLQDMKAKYNALTWRQRHCFDHIFAGFQRLFHGDKA